MQDRVRRSATYADLEAVPPNMVAEIIAGELVAHPRPRPRHIHAGSRLGAVVDTAFGRNGGGSAVWWIFDEPELRLGNDILVPDIAGWQRDRMPTLPDTAFFALPPDWVCEILSPSTLQLDRGSKMAIFASAGVKHLWLIDPDSKLLEVFELRDGLWTLLRTWTDAAEVAAPPFAAVPFSLGLLWPD